MVLLQNAEDDYWETIELAEDNVGTPFECQYLNNKAIELRGRIHALEDILNYIQINEEDRL